MFSPSKFGSGLVVDVGVTAGAAAPVTPVEEVRKGFSEFIWGVGEKSVGG